MGSLPNPRTAGSTRSRRISIARSACRASGFKSGPRGRPGGRSLRLPARRVDSSSRRSSTNMRARRHGHARNVWHVRSHRLPAHRGCRCRTAHGGSILHGSPPGHVARRHRQFFVPTGHGRAVPRQRLDRDRRDPAERANPRQGSARVGVLEERGARGQRPPAVERPAPWSPRRGESRQAIALSNGRLTSVITDSGGGGLHWQGLALTRYVPDATQRRRGLCIDLRDEAGAALACGVERTGRRPSRCTRPFSIAASEGSRFTSMSPSRRTDDVEFATVTLHNETDRPRRASR